MSNLPVDPELVKLIAPLVEGQLKEALRELPQAAHKKWSELIARTPGILNAYLLNAAERHSQTKTFLSRDEPLPLSSFYVPIGLRRGTTILEAPTPSSIESMSRFVTIFGTAGAGKSLFMKYLFLLAIKQKKRIPVLVELRELNEDKANLITLLHDTITRHDDRLTADQLFELLSWGRFILLLDGFDEIRPDKRDETYRFIDKMSDLYHKNMFVLSTRPDNYLRRLPRFSTLYTQPLNLDQATLLVERSNVEVEVKTNFSRLLSERLIHEHASFISNPLLLTIMLLSFNVNADIPFKKHLLFQEVFMALFNQHDALKNNFRRQLHSGLDRDDFERMLEALSIQAHMMSELTINESLYPMRVRTAKQLCNVEVDETAFIHDLIESLCLAIHEGYAISYVHRSIVEFFAAQFISKATREQQKSLAGAITRNFADTYILQLLFEIDRDLCEELFILPTVNELLKTIECSGTVTEQHTGRLLAELSGKLVQDSQSMVWAFEWRNDALQNFLDLLRTLYPLPGDDAAPAGEARLERLVKDKLHGGSIRLSRFDLDTQPLLRKACLDLGLVRTNDVVRMVKVKTENTQRSQSDVYLRHLITVSLKRTESQKSHSSDVADEFYEAFSAIEDES